MKNRLVQLVITFNILSIPLFASTIQSHNADNNIFKVKYSINIYIDSFKINFNDSLLNNVFNRFNKQSNLISFQINYSNNKVSVSSSYGFLTLNDYFKSSIVDTINSIRDYFKSITNNINHFDKHIIFNFYTIDIEGFGSSYFAKIDSLNIPVKFTIEVSNKIDYNKSDELLSNILVKIDSLKQICFLGNNINDSGIQTSLLFTFNNKNHFYEWYKSNQTKEFIQWLKSINDDQHSFKQVLYINFEKLLQN
jgi:hypothetical protein